MLVDFREWIGNGLGSHQGTTQIWPQLAALLRV
jgi:hypothetical protein